MCWCGRGTRTPTGFPPTDFLPTSAFAAAGTGVRGLDYPFTLRGETSPPRLGAARLVSTPSRHCRAWLGIAIRQVPPNLSSSAPPVSRRAPNFSSPLRLPVPPRPHTRNGVAGKPETIKRQASDTSNFRVISGTKVELTNRGQEGQMPLDVMGCQRLLWLGTCPLRGGRLAEHGATFGRKGSSDCSKSLGGIR